jgi:hypothetical protein
MQIVILIFILYIYQIVMFWIFTESYDVDCNFYFWYLQRVMMQIVIFILYIYRVMMQIVIFILYIYRVVMQIVIFILYIYRELWCRSYRSYVRDQG